MNNLLDKLVDNLLDNIASKLPYEVCLKIYEEFLINYYKDELNIIDAIFYNVNNNVKNNLKNIENRRALIRSVKNCYIPKLYDYLKPMNYNETTLALNRCCIWYIPDIHSIDNSIIQHKTFITIIINRCKHVRSLYESMFKPNKKIYKSIIREYIIRLYNFILILS